MAKKENIKSLAERLHQKNELRKKRDAARKEDGEKRAKAIENALKRPTTITESLIDEIFGGFPRPSVSRGWYIPSPTTNHRTLHEYNHFLKVLVRQAPRIFDGDTYRLWRLFSCPHIRNVESWKPSGYGSERLFRSLVNHLVVKYPMPFFLYKSFCDDDLCLLFCHLAAGGSVSKAIETKLLRSTLTKRMAHLFMTMPSEVTSIEAAVRRAQVTAFGGDKRIATTIMKSFLREFQDDEAFWLTVIQWFCNNHMLNPSQIVPLLDYIRYRKQENLAFLIKGRSPLAMIRDMEEWHGILAKQKILSGNAFPESGFKKGKWEDHVRELNDVEPPSQRISWTIEEILSSKELANEGRKMKHCVYSYARSVEKGQISIWSLKLHSENGSFHHLTIEVSNKLRQIVQCRGFANRRATGKENLIVMRWARENGLAYDAV